MEYIRGEAGQGAGGLLGTTLKGMALNCGVYQADQAEDGVDITLAREERFILADASGAIGYNAENPGQRDRIAELAKDADDTIGGEEP